jgi:glucose/mannose-6-phosphate isomerase
MSVLEDRARIEALDPGGMRRHLESFPDQLREAREIGEGVELSVTADGVSAVAVLGMGGSAIGGELASGYLAPFSRVPFVVVRDYSVPAFVGPDTLVYVSSYSGNTEETLAAYEQAAAKGARVVCSTTGGEAGKRASESGHDRVTIPPGYPPRAALGYGLFPLLSVLSRLGLAPAMKEEMDGAVSVSEEAVGRFGIDSPQDANTAKELALWFVNHIAVVYGSAPAMSVVATRWAGQLSENSKVVAHRNELPEMNHNEIVGWAGETTLAGAARVVFLHDEDDHPRVTRRMDITSEIIEETGTPVRDIRSFGEGRLGRLLSLVLLGDFVSFYLAMLAGVDPTPVASIDRLKKALSES